MSLKLKKILRLNLLKSESFNIPINQVFLGFRATGMYDIPIKKDEMFYLFGGDSISNGSLGGAYDKVIYKGFLFEEV